MDSRTRRKDYRDGYADGQLDYLARIRDLMPSFWDEYGHFLSRLIANAQDEDKALEAGVDIRLRG